MIGVNDRATALYLLYCALGGAEPTEYVILDNRDLPRGEYMPQHPMRRGVEYVVDDPAVELPAGFRPYWWQFGYAIGPATYPTLPFKSPDEARAAMTKLYPQATEHVA